MYKIIKHYIQNNKYELVTSFLLFTNLFPKIFPQVLYYISFVLILKKMTEYTQKDSNKTYLFYAFIVFLWITTIIGAYSGGYPFSISGDIRSVSS